MVFHQFFARVSDFESNTYKTIQNKNVKREREGDYSIFFSYLAPVHRSLKLLTGSLLVAKTRKKQKSFGGGVVGEEGNGVWGLVTFPVKFSGAGCLFCEFLVREK